MYFCAGAFGPAGEATAPKTAGGLRPSTIRNLPSGLNFVTVFVPSSTVQILSCIDADGVREFEAVITLSDFLDEVAVLIELPQPRVVAAEKDEDMAFGIRGDADSFAESFAGGYLQ